MSLRRGDRSVLKAGMTIDFMTGLWMQDWGMETIDSIVIIHGAPELLVRVPRKLFVKGSPMRDSPIIATPLVLAGAMLDAGARTEMRV
jgi:hypothetical protein|tara:strand:+ start:4702 stop:4965 length:264 start_codon:yes stop_codon:yes gene_type:complete